MTLSTTAGARRRFLLLVLTACAALPAVAQQPAKPEPTFKIGDLVITAPWTRQPPDGARVAGGFMRITNTGTTSDRLIGGSAPFARRFEVHEMTVVDGVMRMREVAAGLEIKPGETVDLKPGGYHVMYMDITAAPAEGKPVKTKLRFEKAGEIEIDVAVGGMGARGGHGSGTGGGKGGAKAHQH